VIVSTSSPSARKKPLSAAISSGSVLIPGPVEATFIGSREADGDISVNDVQMKTNRKIIERGCEAGMAAACSAEQ